MNDDVARRKIPYEMNGYAAELPRRSFGPRDHLRGEVGMFATSFSQLRDAVPVEN